jgi:uncharacterized repeat protein (TIGR03806 family)
MPEINARPAVLVIALAFSTLPWSPAASQGTGRSGQSKPAEVVAPKVSEIANLPDGFAEKVVTTGLTGATAMAIAPDGRVFVCEQTGALRVVRDEKLLKDPFVTLNVDSSWERGLIGVALDPGFPKKPYIYVCYVADKPYPHHVVSRFTAKGDKAEPRSELVLLEGDDQSKLGGGIPNGHQGGAIHFGKDGKLYIAIGEQTAGEPAQRLDTFQGKLLRLNADGSIPKDNPFFKLTKGKYRAIWALGLRNPFTFAVQPGTGRVFINDVGEARWEEINEGVAGANYGWPRAEGPSTNRKFRNPIHAYDHSVGRSIAGGTFYNPSIRQFPKEYLGKYFFADFMNNWIRTLDPANPKDVREFASGLANPVDLQVGPDGSLYYLNRNAWVRDKDFRPNTGSLRRIMYPAGSGESAPVITAQPAEVTASTGRKVTFCVEAKGKVPLRYQWLRNGLRVGGANGTTLTVTVSSADDGAEFRCLVSNAQGTTKSQPAALWTTPLPKPLNSLRVGLNPNELPRLLSKTGIFRSLRDLTPETGVRSYDVNVPLWSDGAQKRRWLVLPQDSPIGFVNRGPWKFPPGTVIVKHFEMPAGKGKSARWLETRLLVVDRRGLGYGVTYKWRADRSDAELLAEGLTEDFELNGQKRTWIYPSRTDCLVCHTPSSGFVLGVNTRQLNHAVSDAEKPAENLLMAWDRFGLFRPAIGNGKIDGFERLAALADTESSLEHRVRSYLDANCAQCHRPGGARPEFDARFETPLSKQKLVNAPLASSDLGVSGVKLIAPGDTARSMVYLRMARREDVFNMPPLATQKADQEALKVFKEWIDSLPKGDKKSRLIPARPVKQFSD